MASNPRSKTGGRSLFSTLSIGGSGELPRDIRDKIPVGHLKVVVMQGSGLKPHTSDASTASTTQSTASTTAAVQAMDIYVSAQSCYSGSMFDKTTKQKTSVKRGTCDPVWNEQFLFAIKDAHTQSISFHVWVRTARGRKLFFVFVALIFFFSKKNSRKTFLLAMLL